MPFTRTSVRLNLEIYWFILIQVGTYVNPEKLFPKRKGIEPWIIGIAVSAGLLLLFLLIMLLWWVSEKNVLKFKRSVIPHGVIPPNDAGGIANSEDPDQTAPLGAV